MRPRSLIFVALLVLSSACVSTPPNLTPAAQVAFQADQVVLKVNALENAAIAAQANGSISLDTARAIVTFCVGADTVLKAAPLGWQQTILRAWNATKSVIPTKDPTVASLILAVDVALPMLVGGGQ